PGMLPEPPRVALRLSLQAGWRPGAAGVGAHLDAGDFGLAGPGGAVDANLAAGPHRLAGARAGDQRLDLHLRQRPQYRQAAHALVVRVLGRLPESLEWRLGDDDA